MNKFFLPLSVASIACCFGGLTLASTLANTPSLHEFKLKPKVSVWGMTGTSTIAKGQALYPIYGDQSKAFFGLVEGNAITNQKDWYAGAGLGYRQVVNNLIYGGYVIADYATSTAGTHFWVANPGFEVMGKEWDLNINGYIPTTRGKKTLDYGWADDLGIYDYVRFEKHNKYNRRSEHTDIEAMGTGVDLKVGRTIPHLEAAKVYLGGYYFDEKDVGHVVGGLAKVSYEVNKYLTFEVTGTYDNRNHNRALAGIKLTLGGYDKQEKESFGLSGRLMDNVDHGYMNTIIPVVTKVDKIKLSDKEEVQLDNIWFFQPIDAAENGASNGGDGTIENPFTTFTPLEYQKISNTGLAAHLYFKAGYTINLKNFTGYDNKVWRMKLPYNWDISGRNTTFKAPATGSTRPIFIGGLDLCYDVLTNDTIYLNSIIIKTPANQSSYDYTAGIIRMKNAQNVAMNTVSVGTDSLTNGGANVGVDMTNSTLNLYSTDIHAVAANSNEALERAVTTGATGVLANNSSLIFYRGANGNNSIKATTTGSVTDGAVVNTKGIDALNHSIITFYAPGTVTAQNKNISAIGHNNVSINAYGISANDTKTTFGLGSKGSAIYASNSTVKANNALTATACGIYTTGTGTTNRASVIISDGVTMSATNSAITASDAANVTAYDIYGNRYSTTTINNNTTNTFTALNQNVNVTTNANVKAYGIYEFYFSSMNLLGTSTFNIKNNLVTATDNLKTEADGLWGDSAVIIAISSQSINNVQVTNSGITALTNSSVTGIGAKITDGSVLSLLGGTNTFTVRNSGKLGASSNFYSYGLFATSSIISLQNGTPKIDLGVSGTATNKQTVGIYADSLSSLKVGTAVVSDLSVMANRFIWASALGTTPQYKISWDGHGNLVW